jgi:hypothetical protein
MPRASAENSNGRNVTCHGGIARCGAPAVHHMHHPVKRGRATRPKISRDCKLVGANLTVNRVVHRCTGAPMRHVHHPKKPCGAPVHRCANAPRAPPQENGWRAIRPPPVPKSLTTDIPRLRLHAGELDGAGYSENNVTELPKEGSRQRSHPLVHPKWRTLNRSLNQDEAP